MSKKAISYLVRPSSFVALPSDNSSSVECLTQKCGRQTLKSFSHHWGTLSGDFG